MFTVRRGATSLPIVATADQLAAAFPSRWLLLQRGGDLAEPEVAIEEPDVPVPGPAHSTWKFVVATK